MVGLGCFVDLETCGPCPRQSTIVAAKCVSASDRVRINCGSKSEKAREDSRAFCSLGPLSLSRRTDRGDL